MRIGINVHLSTDYQAGVDTVAWQLADYETAGLDIALLPETLGVVASARSEEDQVVRDVIQQLEALLAAPLLERSLHHLGGAPESAPAIWVGTARVGGDPASHPADRRVTGADGHA
ncbi:hypothetical protein [Streptomyces sp. Tue6028]|uniref:hypothetical protein n=1 Tax=Streptomyces sp. Tue6028 TaxID=2036037 RepID=UPI003EB7DDCA